MRLRVLIAMSMLAASGPCLGADNQRLVELVRADQAEREAEWKPQDIPEIVKRDASRRAQVQEELAAGRVRSAVDFFNSALVMQHGATLEDIRMAHALSTIAASLDPLDRSARWLMAASWDRMLTSQKKPQWYGTQYTRDAGGKWALLPVDETAVTDADRVALAVPTLAEAKKRVEDMNRAR